MALEVLDGVGVLDIARWNPADCSGSGTYCVTSPNSVGPGSTMGFLGTTSVSAQKPGAFTRSRSASSAAS